jgi:hypothetical protein
LLVDSITPSGEYFVTPAQDGNAHALFMHNYTQPEDLAYPLPACNSNWLCLRSFMKVLTTRHASAAMLETSLRTMDTTSLRKGYRESTLTIPQNNICRHPNTCHIPECNNTSHGECSNTCINSLMF